MKNDKTKLVAGITIIIIAIVLLLINFRQPQIDESNSNNISNTVSNNTNNSSSSSINNVIAGSLKYNNSNLGNSISDNRNTNYVLGSTKNLDSSIAQNILVNDSKSNILGANNEINKSISSSNQTNDNDDTSITSNTQSNSEIDKSISSNIQTNEEIDKSISSNIQTNEEIPNTISSNEISNSISDNLAKEPDLNSNDKTKNNLSANTISYPTNYNVYVNKSNNIINSDVKLPPNPEFALYVNKSLNVVTAFYINENNEEIPFKAMLCSCGRPGHGTPSGTFKTTNYYDWRLMVDNTYGKYAVRFNNKILFHSVPYYKTTNDSLEWDQFNLLGSNASLGCVRMAVVDVKWIYDNCKEGTKVVVYTDENSPGPLGKPEPIKIPEDSPYRDWDPTDPDINNPWNKTSN